ncbi:MAG: hypothetical protein JNJ46_07040 [Myxococcales bacterium]|jgi:hypothetical protein|nr:hypothetical protein [Myxococcales bacterium]
MTRKTRSIVTALLLAMPLSLLSACGGVSSLDLCYTACDNGRKCLSSNDATYTNCRNDCNANKGALADQDAKLARDCKNASEIMSKRAACYNKSCLEILTCLASSDTNACVKP